MDQNHQFGDLLDLAGQNVVPSEPGREEYFRGYRQGRELHQEGRQEETAQVYFRFYRSYKETREPYPDAYLRGFMDGCNGLTPEGAGKSTLRGGAGQSSSGGPVSRGTPRRGCR